MNNKLVKGSLAGVAALALAAGGSTFAAWSDLGFVNNNKAGAGHLVLNVGKSITSSESMLLAPGENQSIDFYIASNDGHSVPNGELFITLKDLVDHEDGCTSNSEAVAENGGDENVPFQPGYDAALACGSNVTGNDNGELSKEARMEIIQYGPSANGVCGNPASNSVVQNFATVEGLENTKLPVVQLAPGEGTCVRAIVKLNVDPNPAAADNKVQGDSISWNFRFDLEQVI